MKQLRTLLSPVPFVVAALASMIALVSGVAAARAASVADASSLSPSRVTAYVANNTSQSVTPIDLATNTPGTPIGVGAGPSAVAITPDGKTAYVIGNFGTVTPIDLATNTPRTVIPVGHAPGGIAITPDGKTAYVTINSSNYVTPIDLATSTPRPPITVGNGPFGIAITPDSNTAYVANASDNTVSPIDLATNTPGTAIPVGSRSFGTPVEIAITPDGATAYVTNYGDNTVTPIDVATNTAGTPIPIPGLLPTQGVFGIAITPDGKTAYVANWRGAPWVTPIDLTTNTTGTPITVGGAPFGIAITPDGKTAYVTSQEFNGTVTPIDLATNTPGTPIPTGGFPQGIAIAITPMAADTTPPILSLPTDIVTNATGPAGATVTYIATATDAVDGAIAVTCAPPSGSLFAIGDTLVECAATDAAGNTATASFTVHVKGAIEQLDDLVALLDSYQIAGKHGASLHQKLIAARNWMVLGKRWKAGAKLDSFLQEVEKQTGKAITVAQASELTLRAERIKDVLAV